MAFTYRVDTAIATGGPTSGIDTSLCEFLVIGVASQAGGANNTPTDNKSNTWVARTRQTAFSSRAIRIWYCVNPTVGTGHTFTQTEGGTQQAVGVIGFSGVDTSTPYDSNENTNGAADITTLSSGSVTPSQANCLILNFSLMEDNGPGVTTGTLDSSYITKSSVAPIQFNNTGIVIGYIIQTSAGASNPTWTYDHQAHVGLTDVTVFRAASAGGSSKRPKGPNVVDTQFHSSYRERLKKPTLEEIMYYNKRKAA